MPQLTVGNLLEEQSDSMTLIMAEEYKGTSYIDILNNVYPSIKRSEKGKINTEKLPYLKNVVILSDEKYECAYNWLEIMERSETVADDQLET